MARPRRKGLGYFPLDTHFMSDRKIQRLAQRYGCNGICIYIAVLCEAYGENGYYACYDGDFCFDIGFTTGQDEKLVKEIIEFCVQIRLFDSELMEYRQILSSVGIQQRFEEISRRTAMQIDAETQPAGTQNTANAARYRHRNRRTDGSRRSYCYGNGGFCYGNDRLCSKNPGK